MYLSWLLLGAGSLFGCWRVVVVDILRQIGGIGGKYILAGGTWWLVVVQVVGGGIVQSNPFVRVNYFLLDGRVKTISHNKAFYDSIKAR